MIAPVIVVGHETRQAAFQFPRTAVFLKLYDVFHQPVIAFDLALRHRVIRGALRVREAFRDVTHVTHDNDHVLVIAQRMA